MNNIKFNNGINKNFDSSSIHQKLNVPQNQKFQLPVANSMTQEPSSQLLTQVHRLMQIDILNNTQLLKSFDSIDKSFILKNLLNLPQDYASLLNLFSSNQNLIANTLNLKNYPLFNLFDFIKTIQANGQESLAKLFNLTVQYSKAGLLHTESIRELAAMLSAITPNAETQLQQALKNIMLLYLPWFPLGEQTNFELDLNFQEENEIVNKQNSIVILITTKNYGNIKVVLSRIKNSTISILISCLHYFPEKLLSRLIKEEAKKNNITTSVEFENIKQDVTSNKKNNNSNPSKANFNMGTSNNNLDSYLLLMAHIVIKLIIGIDKNQNS